ncbi:SPOR domain-containing protein [Sphingomonas hengshuiensis]|uniref:SPOR domain-containing protein n=1 Tax=Sphingomonas hengshuiensis TaxID=1609977 RepID=UPI0009817211|nr:SPOR domain-containing protein [Sphingomonas hengshuiensis]
MKWNTSLAAALSLSLAACGGGAGYADYAPEGAPPPGSVAAQGWAAPEPLAAETWRAADGTIRTRPVPAPPEVPIEQSEPAPLADDRPGAAYAAPPPVSPTSPSPAYRDAAQLAYTPPQDGYADPTAGATGPRGSSQPGPGEARYDAIGYAGIRPVAGGAASDSAIVAVHPSLPANTVVEVTSLDTGRTILVLVTGAMAPDADRAIDLSAAAARQLGAEGTGRLAVRVRKVAATPQDMLALRSGRPAAERPDTPPVLLTALRKRLPGIAAARPSYAASRPDLRPAAPAPTPRRPAPTAGGTGYYVQVAALSNARNAQALAQSMGGFVKQGGGLYRVQLGPFASTREAESARIGAARAGYGDARVLAK